MSNNRNDTAQCYYDRCLHEIESSERQTGVFHGNDVVSERSHGWLDMQSPVCSRNAQRVQVEKDGLPASQHADIFVVSLFRLLIQSIDRYELGTLCSNMSPAVPSNESDSKTSDEVFAFFVVRRTVMRDTHLEIYSFLPLCSCSGSVHFQREFDVFLCKNLSCQFKIFQKIK